MCDELWRLSCELIANPGCQEKSRALSTRVHFACLLWEHVAEEYIEVCEESFSSDFAGISYSEIISVIQALSNCPLLDNMVRLVHGIVRLPDNDMYFEEKR